MQEPRHQTKHLNRLPPTDRRTKRTNESSLRTIPATLLWNTSRSMGSMAPTPSVHVKCLAQHYHQKDTVRINFRIYPPSAPTHQKPEHPRPRPETPESQPGTTASPRSDDQGTRKPRQSQQVHAIPRRRQSLVGRNEYQKALCLKQIIPKAVRTLQGSHSDLKRRLLSQTP